jgi:hypothetical protein
VSYPNQVPRRMPMPMPPLTLMLMSVQDPLASLEFPMKTVPVI